MDINIKDYFRIDDSHSKIRGFVFAYDENDKIVFHKENMITKTGRKSILNAITGGSNLNLKGLTPALGVGRSMTTPDTATLESIIPSEHLEISPVTAVVSNTNDLYISFEFTVNMTEAAPTKYEISELALMNGGSLFSRVVFQPYTLNAETTLKFKYYIYF